VGGLSSKKGGGGEWKSPSAICGRLAVIPGTEGVNDWEKRTGNAGARAWIGS